MIDLDAVTLAYGKRVILNDVTLTIRSGDFFFLTGPSGVGKSTLLRLCAGMQRPSRGTVKVFGRDMLGLSSDAQANTRRRLGIIHQDAQFLDHLSLAENVILPFTVRGPVSKEKREQRDDLLEWVALDHRRDALPPSLSGGERQRAALARALVSTPEVILADEPTGNLDWDMSLRLLGLLIELNKIGTPVVLATHDLALIRAAKSMVDARVLRLKDGQLSLAGAAL
ncbi:MAG: ATP-binding cassette domain-containing protein [Pseudomonadota bacterium]